MQIQELSETIDDHHKDLGDIELELVLRDTLELKQKVRDLSHNRFADVFNPGDL